MEFYTAHLQEHQPVSSSHCSIKSSARTAEVFQKIAGGTHPYLIVEDEAGQPVGVIGAEDILKRITDRSPLAFTRWMDMPVEAALQGRIEMPTGGSKLAKDTKDATVTCVSKDGQLLGMITEHDVLISWRSIQKTLRTSLGDAVTQLPNRTAFDSHLDAECNRGLRCCHSVAVILVDLDDFKQINDRFGHAAGDAALNLVGSTLRKSLRSYDLVARFGGDEFAIICSGCRPGEIDIVVRRIREVILALQKDPTAPRPVPSISVGVCVVHDLSQFGTSAGIVKAADECLYAAKAAGRNCAWKSEIIPGIPAPPEPVADRCAHPARRSLSGRLAAVDFGTGKSRGPGAGSHISPTNHHQQVPRTPC